METKNTDNPNHLEAFLSGGSINLDELGEPPLANTKDSLLDRERIHLQPVDEADPADEVDESE